MCDKIKNCDQNDVAVIYLTSRVIGTIVPRSHICDCGSTYYSLNRRGLGGENCKLILELPSSSCLISSLGLQIPLNQDIKENT